MTILHFYDPTCPISSLRELVKDLDIKINHSEIETKYWTQQRCAVNLAIKTMEELKIGYEDYK